MLMTTTTCGDDRALNNSRVERQQPSRALHYITNVAREIKQPKDENRTGKKSREKIDDMRNMTCHSIKLMMRI